MAGMFRDNRDVYLCSKAIGYTVETPAGSTLARFVSRDGAVRELTEHGYKEMRGAISQAQGHWHK